MPRRCSEVSCVLLFGELFFCSISEASVWVKGIAVGNLAFLGQVWQAGELARGEG